MKLYPLPRTAIEAEILFTARVKQVRFLELVSGKTPREQSSSGKKIGAESAVLHFVFFIVIVNKMQQSAKERCLLKRNAAPEVFPLTIGSGKTMPFEKRHAGCEERGKINRRRIYDTLRINFFEATKQTACIFSKGEETGVNYYGARYLDPKYSRWLSGDPALSDYIPKAPIDDEAKKHNENLPGMGGVFNVVNLHLYHYAGNNPIKYEDPNGEFATLVGMIIGGIAGGVSALTQGHKFSSKGFWAGVAGGIVSGALSGLAVDITVATGGIGAIPIIGAGGALGGGLGSITESLISNDDLSLSNVLLDAAVGGVANLIGFGIGNAIANSFEKALGKELVTKGSKLYNAVHTPIGNSPSGTQLMQGILNRKEVLQIIASRGVDIAISYIADLIQDAFNP